MALDQTDPFSQNFQTNHLKLIGNETNWTSLTSNEEDLKIDFKDVSFGTFNDFDLLLNENIASKESKIQTITNDINKNQIQHAAQCDLTEFESVDSMPDLSAKDLIIKEVIEDLILRTFCLDRSTIENELDTVETESDTENPRVRRCSSLKSRNTPPDTPSCKKIVRFADVLGLDLADVRTYLDDIPRVPSSAYKDLTNCEIESCCPKNATRHLVALFQQPVSTPNFLGMVTMSMVAVENAYVDDPVSFCIKGSIRVRNISFHKSVHVRYTMDKWRKSSDVEAAYVRGSSDGFTDQFQFMLYAYGLDIGEKLEFAVRYRVDGQEFWDNNNAHNYCFQCLPTEVPQQAPMTPGINEQFVTFYYGDQNDDLENDGTDADASGIEQETVFDSANTKPQLSSSEVQEIIARSLGKHKMADVSSAQENPKPEVLIFFIVLFLSIVALYAKRMLF